MQERKEKWWRRERWRYAGGAFLVGASYSVTAVLIGLEVRLGGLDVALLVSLLLELSFAVFGYLIGLVVELRRDERRAATEAQERLFELGEMKGRLAQTEKLASLGQLASTIAHEVRNPLAILRSMTQNLAEELPNSSTEARSVCDDLIEEIDRLASVTSRLVDFARPVSLRPSRLEIRELAERVRLLSTAALDGEGLRLRLRGEPGLEIVADGDLLSQLLLGLVENAVAASPGGGTIELAWWPVDGQHVEIRVEDEGAGVPEELEERIFEPFFTTRPNGHGLGLAVARHLAEAHDGRIWVEPAWEDRVGAAFVVQLPVGREALLA